MTVILQYVNYERTRPQRVKNREDKTKRRQTKKVENRTGKWTQAVKKRR